MVKGLFFQYLPSCQGENYLFDRYYTFVDIILRNVDGERRINENTFIISCIISKFGNNAICKCIC